MATNIHIVYGPDGTILAASKSERLPMPGHVQGVTVDKFEVPSKFHDKEIHEYIPHLVVDVEARKLRLK
jgi:hypothetical protein